MKWVTFQEAKPVPRECDKFDLNRITQVSHRCFLAAVDPQISRLEETEDRQKVFYDVFSVMSKYIFKREDELTPFLIKKQAREVLTEDDKLLIDQLFAERDDMKNWEFSHFERGAYDGVEKYRSKDVIAWIEVSMPDVQLVQPLADVWKADLAVVDDDTLSEHEIVVRTGSSISRGTIMCELMHDDNDEELY